MGQAFLMGAGGGGYAEGDTIPTANLQPIYKEDLNYTDETRIVSNIEGVTNYGYLTVNPNGNTLYYSNNGSLRIYSATGTLISSISTSAYELKFDSDGNAYYRENNTIKKIASNGTVSDFITLTSSSTLWEWSGNVLYTVTHATSSYDGFRKYNQAGQKILEKTMTFSFLSQMVTDTNGNFYVAPNETSDNITKYSSEGVQVATTYSGYTTTSMLWVSNYLYLIRYDNSDYEVVRCPDDLSSDTTMATYSSLSNLPDAIKATTITGTTRLFVRMNNTGAGYGFELRDLNYGLLADYKGSYNTKNSYNNSDVGANGEIFYLRAPKDINRLHTTITGYKVLSED